MGLVNYMSCSSAVLQWEINPINIWHHIAKHVLHAFRSGFIGMIIPTVRRTIRSMCLLHCVSEMFLIFTKCLLVQTLVVRSFLIRMLYLIKKSTDLGYSSNELIEKVN